MRRVVSGLWIVMLAAPLLAFSSGPPDGVAGDPPGNQTCARTGCHAGVPNSGNGQILILGLPSHYIPDSQIILQIFLRDPDPQRRRWGFELTVITADGLQGGVLESLDNTTQVSLGPGNQRDYAKHTSAGTFFGQPDSAIWQIRWIAPPVGTGPVTFYIAGNAANGNGAPTGDNIYTASFTVEEFAVGIAEESPFLRPIRLRAFPALVTSEAWIRWTLPVSGPYTLLLASPAGRQISVLEEGSGPAGAYEVRWVPRDLPSGHYLLLLKTPAGVSRFPVVLLK